MNKKTAKLHDARKEKEKIAARLIHRMGKRNKRVVEIVKIAKLAKKAKLVQPN